MEQIYFKKIKLHDTGTNLAAMRSKKESGNLKT